MSQGADLTILGAGVCGLYAALTAARAGARVTILEKGQQPGGLAAGFRRGSNHYDQGVHMLHAADAAIFEDVAALMGDERLPVQLDARICWNGRSYRYPLRGWDLLAGMPPGQLARCVAGLFSAELRNRLQQTQAAAVSAEDALIATYGAPLYEFFFEDFTHRYWGIHPAELSAEFVRRKMPRLTILDVVKKCLPSFLRSRAMVVESAIADETLHYSASGSETLPRVLAREVVRLGGEIHYGVEIASIGGGVIQLGDRQPVPYQKILSTVPLPTFIELLEEAPEAVRAAARSLHYKPIVSYGLRVARERCLEGIYTYYRNRIFHRVGEPKAAGLQVEPAGHTVLVVEMTCDQGDAKWVDAPEVRHQVVADLAAEGICDESDIVEWHHFTHPHGYPIYRLDFEKPLQVVQDWLATQPGLVSTGRQGSFTYPNMHQAMRMGQRAAEDLLAQGKDPQGPAAAAARS